MEQFGGIYDGALCTCGEGSGATRIWDQGVPGFLSYDIIFGIPNSWGTVGEVRNDLDFETEVAPKLDRNSAFRQTFPSLNSFDWFPEYRGKAWCHLRRLTFIQVGYSLISSSSRRQGLSCNDAQVDHSCRTSIRTTV